MSQSPPLEENAPGSHSWYQQLSGACLHTIARSSRSAGVTPDCMQSTVIAVAAFFAITKQQQHRTLFC